ncbi:MAG: phosphoadenosine phosphosulfate reductase family protein, partial [Clostridia bacterium]|nr:phosphoadenosine phosphosulfate reductase family protein [Clostridia bacterium]
MDYELTLFDRIEVIKTTNKKFDLEHNAYLSFSGGKDSTILHYLLDMALPNNEIPRVYIDTGIEYQMIREFVLEMAKNDKRFVIIKPSQPIKQTLERFGYPFKSKEHSLRVDQFNKGTNAKFIKKYLWQTEYRGKYLCPKILLYQFEETGKYNFSNKCCY